MSPASLQGLMLGKYRVLEPLGHGGMARVYRGYHPQLDRYVAIKVLRSDLVEEPEFLARFRREAQSVAALRHPHIINVFDFDVQDEVSYMVMELLEGDTLKARLLDYRMRGESMPVGEMVRVLLDALDGLAYAHEMGMIHRDIKPANIMLTGRGQAVLTDFGIAQIVGGTNYTVSGALMGTLNYMAPEQGLQKGDARSDLYSMGIVLYEMFTGQTPFEADTPLAILMKHLNDPLPLPRSVNPDMPEPFERVLLKVLSKHPEDRYQTAAEMAAALRAAAEQAQVTLPDSISLPLSFTTAEAPTEPVNVISGTAREKLKDTNFAAGDTDASLGQKLTAARAATAASAEAACCADGNELAPRGVIRAGMALAGLIIAPNLLGLMWSGIVGNWNVFAYGWPLEILFLALGLSVMMEALALIWIVVPVSLFTGIGLTLGFYMLSNMWDRWFLWPLLPFWLGGAIALALWRIQRPGHTRFARRLAEWLCLGLAAAISMWIFALVFMVR